MKRKLLKKYAAILAVIACLFLMTSIMMGKKEEGAGQEQQTEQKDHKESVETAALEKETGNDFEELCRTLNTDLFGNETLLPWFEDETKQEIEAYAESVKGNLVEVWEKDCIIPQGLVLELENMIYQSLNKSMDKISWEEIQQSVYFKTMRELGEEKWHPDMEEMKILFPELNEDGLELDSVYDAYSAACGNEYCYDLFHIPTPDSDN